MPAYSKENSITSLSAKITEKEISVSKSSLIAKIVKYEPMNLKEKKIQYILSKNITLNATPKEQAATPRTKPSILRPRPILIPESTLESQ